MSGTGCREYATSARGCVGFRMREFGKRRRFILRAAACLLATTALAAPALAQQADPYASLDPPVRQAVDDNGIDLATGIPTLSAQSVSIGAGSQGLSYQRTLRKAGWSNPYYYAVSGDPSTTLHVAAGSQSYDFTFSSATNSYVNSQGGSETLIGSGSTWTFTDAKGTVIQMDATDFDPSATAHGPNAIAVAHTIALPSGEKLTLTYKQLLDATKSHVRLQSVQSSSGYMAKLAYADNSATYSIAWTQLAKVTLVNSAVDYCSPSADSCTFSVNWPSLTFTRDTSAIPYVDTVADTLGRTTTYFIDSFKGLTGVRRPTSASNNIAVAYDVNNRVSSVAVDGRTWNYSWSLASPLMTATITNPDGSTTRVVTDTTLNTIKSETDELSRTTSFTYDAQGRVTDLLYPEGNKDHYTYNARGNVIEKRMISKTPGTPADIVISASYVVSCTNALTCNRPSTTTDARGNISSYTYDSSHGGVLSITRPAPTTGAVQPQIRLGYTALQAYFKNSSGTIVASGKPTYVLTSTSLCQALASCLGAADEVKSTVSYGSQSSGSPNNLLPMSISSGSGDGALTATRSFTYDNFGNLTFIDGPLAGAADTVRTLYDAGRQVIGQIGADPDGAGVGQPNRAVRTTYDLDGQATKVERGTSAGQSDSNWTAFLPAEVVDIGYEASGREATRKLSRSGTAFALSQTSYDANGRLQCSAVRMNAAAFSALPATACTVGTAGSDGNDRISRISYDAAGQTTKVQEGFGTAEVRSERTLTYTNNGLVQNLLDGDSNLTTYNYDGFDRLVKTQYPTPSQGAGTSSATDYEQLTYDAASNVTSRRLRDGTSIAYTYDNLNRATFKNLPGIEPDVTYAYDNLGRITSASQTGNGLSFTYDALSRRLSEGGPQGTVTSAYDLAGNRTQVTYPGTGLTVNYDYLVTGDLQRIRENGATTGIGLLASYAYDSVGNRSGVTYGNGVVQNYGSDGISRLQTLTIDLPGTTNDLTIGGASTPITYNASSQILSAPRSNTVFSYSGYSSVSHDYGVNGLNQYVSNAWSGTLKNLNYDSKGNLASDGTNSFGYSSENLLSTAPGTTLAYDPLLRLYQVAGSVTTRFGYDGTNIIADYDQANTLQHRYVFGPGVDEPVVEYAGTGTTSRTFLYADERGSIIGRTDSSGALVTANSYDEYGIPGSSNVGLFQYTGQAWISQLGMYSYKARLYSPTLGRFLQTDPIGYADGANWYAYVGDDPINNRDPSGLGGCPPGVGGEIVVCGNLKKDAPPVTDNRSNADFKPQLKERIGKEPQNDDIVVTAKRHRYVLPYLNPCSASSVFGYFKQAGHSAPGAPAAREGFTRRLVLTGGNPISQFVNSSTGTIINTTLPGHRYYPGTVTIQVTPNQGGQTSTTVITGEGTGAHSEENVILGEAFFGGQAAGAQTACGI